MASETSLLVLYFELCGPQEVAVDHDLVMTLPCGIAVAAAQSRD
jgi:hypothetical protein